MTKKELKVKAMSEVAKIQEFLREWDPINVFSEPDHPKDEYDSYAPHIHTLLKNGANAEQIANHLTLIETRFMGFDSKIENNFEIASKICEWWNNK